MRITAAIFTLITTAASAHAQPLAFDVASIKPNHTGQFRRVFPNLRNGTFTAQITSLKTLISIAYGLNELRINGPGWIDTEKYDITAKAPSGVPDTELKPLLQSLLKERFHLESHFDMKEMPVYNLVVSKGGAKLKPFDLAHPPEAPPNRGQPFLMGTGTSAQLADMLVRVAERPVLDKTGMEAQGRLSYALAYAPLSAKADADPAATDLFTAIEEQLGLKLESAKETLQILIVDNAERVPAEN